MPGRFSRPVKLPRWLYRKRVEWWTGFACLFGTLTFAQAATNTWYWFAAVAMLVGTPLLNGVRRHVPKIFYWDDEQVKTG